MTSQKQPAQATPRRSSQLAKFKEAAREHGADESEDTFNSALKAIAIKKGVPEALERLADDLGQNDPKFKSD